MPVVEDPSTEHFVIEDEEDVEEIKTAPDPKLPSAEEVEEHRCIHVPYRDWCKWCVMGRGRGLQHSRALASWIAIVGIDYFFITRGGLKSRKDLESDFSLDGDGEDALNVQREEGEIIKCIIIRCLQTKVIFTHVVPYKGVGEDSYVSNLVVADIEWIGHKKLIIKSDNEPALRALVVRSLEMARVQCQDVSTISQEHPARYDSQSNGGVEVGVQIIRGLFRTLKLCLEARIGKFVPVEHSIISWLVEHAALIVNVRVKGSDGLTAWARVRGRSFNQRLMAFGEKVLFKLPSKGPHADPDGNMGTKWSDGVFLGYHRSSNSYLVCSDKGVTTCRSVARRPIEHRWCADTLSQVQATPWSLYAKPESEVRFHEPAPGGSSGDVETAARPALRRMRINKADLDKYGYTAECPTCRHVELYGKSKPGTPHTETCRRRIIEAMSQDEVGKQRIAEYDLKVDREIAERIGEADRGRDRPAPAEPAGSGAPRNELGVPQEAAAHPRQERRRERARFEDAPPAHAARPVHGGAGGAEPPEQVLHRPAEPSAPDERRGEQVGHPTPTDAGVEYDQQMEELFAPDDDAMSMGFLGSLQPSAGDEVSRLLLQELGSVGRSYKRERRKGFRNIVSEVYSPPRVTAEIKRQRNREVLPGFA